MIIIILKECYINLNLLKLVYGGTDGVDDEGDYGDDVYV